MCGIGGILHARPEHPVEPSALRQMQELLRHRGPDAQGIWMDPAEPAVGLCHTRLSILDLSDRARQPMASASERFVLSYNGEVYNYRELRKQLEAEGCIFQSDGDTEVILQLLERWGRDGIERLEGMFAFALYDREERRLLLARDRAGIKPLFWVTGDAGFAFASEPKALPRLREWASPNPAAIAEYLAFRHLAGRESLLGGVETLAPGHWLETDGDDITIGCWWRPTATQGGDPADVAQAVRSSVERQLVSDVPIGIFLSGGIDSSVVAGAAAELAPSLDTFTVGFDEAGWDESDRSRVVSGALDTRAHIVQLDRNRYLELLGEALWHLDSPLNHAHSPHLLELSRRAREVITVALTGEGGDELYGGYPRYRLFLAARRLSVLPSGVLQQVAGAVGRVRPRWGRLLEAAARNDLEAAAINSAFLPIEEAARLAGLERADSALEPRLGMIQATPGQAAGEALLSLEQRTYMVSLLQRMDRMSMAAGLECRVPLIDELVMAHAASLPIDDKFDLFETKKPLRRESERRFGARYANAPKSGFGVPLDDWFRSDGDVALVLERVLVDRRTEERGWFDTGLARMKLGQHRAGSHDHTEALWGLLNLELWARICVDGEPRDSVLPANQPVS